MPAIDAYAPYLLDPTGSAQRIVEVTPDDGLELEFVTRALNVAVSGVVRVQPLKGDPGDVYITAGVAFPIRVTRVFATGTTATGIRALD